MNECCKKVLRRIESMMHTTDSDYYYHITKGTWDRFKKKAGEA